ncbi:MAG: hypothetical protein Q9174_000968 [Haloplaca sp. 1 TL-2023]
MSGHGRQSSPASEAITSALTAGTTSLSGASLTNAGLGPDPAISSGPGHLRKDGCFAQWKKLLGLDTFVTIAFGRKAKRRRGNPFSRGVITNCKDFWFDPSPYFGRRENGNAMLEGEMVNYTKMYESPPRMRLQKLRGDEGGGRYQSVDSEDAV